MFFAKDKTNLRASTMFLVSKTLGELYVAMLWNKDIFQLNMIVYLKGQVGLTSQLEESSRLNVLKVHFEI